MFLWGFSLINWKGLILVLDLVIGAGSDIGSEGVRRLVGRNWPALRKLNLSKRFDEIKEIIRSVIMDGDVSSVSRSSSTIYEIYT